MKKFTVVLVMFVFAFMTVHVLASDYIGNANSGKFHYADCPAVAKMNPANKIYLNTREEAINAGYVPCRRCNP